MNWKQRQSARHDGARAAQRTFEALQLPLDAPVDIFQVIQDANIWLMFQPLSGVYGAYQRELGTSGILINARHPLPLQRSTAAHEYGHHVLGHEASLDSEGEIEKEAAENVNEIAAYAFAADFLMPLGLVNRTLRELGLDTKPRHLTPLDIYRMSVLMETSYAATVFHLVNLKKLSVDSARVLRQIPPKEIKEAEIGGPLQQSRADCWFLDERQSGRLIRPRIGDEIHLRLPVTPATGHIWQFTEAGRDKSAQPSLRLLHEDFSNKTPGLIGARGAHRLAFRVERPLHHTLEVLHGRPWDMAHSTTGRFQIEINAVEGPIGARTQGLTARQQAVLANN